MRRTFLELASYSVILERLFLRHQGVLLSGDLTDACARFEHYRSELAHRFWEEERYLFPVYQETSRWADDDLVVHLRDSHRAISGLLQEIHRRLSRLPDIEDMDERTIVTLKVLELEATLKKRLEADSLQKNKEFYPALDRRIPDAMKAVILDRCTSLTAERRSSPRPPR